MNGYIETDKTREVQEFLTCCENAKDGNEYWTNRRDSARLVMDEAAGVDVDRFLAIMAWLDLPQIVEPPEPETMTAWEFPWTDEEIEFCDCKWNGAPKPGPCPICAADDLQDLIETQDDARGVGLQ